VLRIPGDKPSLADIVARRELAGRSDGGLSRRELLRKSLLAGVALLGVELGALFVGGMWPTGSRASSRVRVGTLDELIVSNPGLPIADGFPAYVPSARAFVVLLDPARRAFLPGVDDRGDGTALNVRALSQVCPHLGCRPNPCIEDFWLHCPCHQSRYDRRGTKIAGERYGPAPRSMDRFPIEVDADGALTIDTGRVIRGPAPKALGEPGVELPRVTEGCA
jgi:nitrite reductase/ring-hydroxylating ferredoxin subunit